MPTDMMLLILISEQIDKNPHKDKTGDWIKRRHELGTYQYIIKELIDEDRCGFKQMRKILQKSFKMR